MRVRGGLYPERLAFFLCLFSSYFLTFCEKFSWARRFDGTTMTMEHGEWGNAGCTAQSFFFHLGYLYMSVFFERTGGGRDDRIACLRPRARLRVEKCTI
jgi:hypothetical protein